MKSLFVVFNFMALFASVQCLDPELRREAWKYLLNYFPFEVTDIERMELRDKKEREYWKMKQQWQTISEAQEKRFSKWRDSRDLISE